MSRSCQRATSSSAACALPRSTRARPEICSLLIGLRLWGIAEEPFWPARKGSCTSRTSVRCRWRISVASRSRPAPAIAIAVSSSAWRSRATTCVETSSRARPSRASTRCLEVGARRRVGADRAGDRADRRLGEGAIEALGVAVRLEGEAGELDAEGGRLGVHAMRAADAERARVLARARGQRSRRARARPRRSPRRPPTAAARAPCRARRRRSGRSGSSARPRRPTRRARRRRPRRRAR